MLFYEASIARYTAMTNSTSLVLTDRNDLVDQLFGQCQRCHEHLGPMPKQAESVTQRRELLSSACGGVVFTTKQMFRPNDPGLLCARPAWRVLPETLRVLLNPIRR